MTHVNRALKRVEVVFPGGLSGQKIYDKAFFKVNCRPPVTAVKELALEFFENPFNTGIQFHWAAGRFRTNGGFWKKAHRLLGAPSAVNDCLVKHQFLMCFLIESVVHLFKTVYG